MTDTSPKVFCYIDESWQGLVRDRLTVVTKIAWPDGSVTEADRVALSTEGPR